MLKHPLKVASKCPYSENTLGLEDPHMTNEQRKSITTLRSQGYGYTAIAKTIGLSKDSVKAYCRSHGLAGVLAKSNAHLSVETDRCLQCNTPISQIPKQKRRKFCCKSCREKWWNSHQNQVKQRAIYHYTCPACNQPFTAYGNCHRKYCSHSCYIKARFGGASV